MKHNEGDTAQTSPHFAINSIKYCMTHNVLKIKKLTVSEIKILIVE